MTRKEREAPPVFICGDFSTEDGHWHSLPYAECRKCSSCAYQARYVKRVRGEHPTFACKACWERSSEVAR